MTHRPLLAGFLLCCAALAAQAHDYTLGQITVGHPHARATAPGQPTGGAYLRLENRGPADRLVAVRADVSQAAELHEMKMDGDVMRMRQIEAIDLPSDKVVVLQPGGLHIMLVGLKSPLKVGHRFPMTLRFERAGELQVDVTVDAVKPAEGAHRGMKH